MSIEAVKPVTSGGFVYEGCYRPRGSLSFAEQSAWGLRCTAPSISTTHPKRRELEVPRLANPCSRSPFARAQTFAAISGKKAPLRLGQHVRLPAGTPRCSATRRETGKHVQAQRRHQCNTWRRFRFIMSGRTITCLNVGSRWFVTGTVIGASNR